MADAVASGDPDGDLRIARVDRIVVTYLVVASCWILVTGPVSAWLADRVDVPVVALELAKGLAFVVVTGLALRLALRRWAGRIAAAALREREAAAGLQEAADLRSAFLNGVSHELRTPLTSIIGYADTVRTLCERGEHAEVAVMSDRLVASAERLERLVLDLLDADALLRGMARPRLRTVDVAALVQRVVSAAELQDQVTLHGERLDADVDVAKFERIVWLLLDNAHRHTPEGTPILVRWGRRDDDLLLIIEDDGPGLPPEVVRRAFEPFVQGGAAARGHHPGTGIGLTLVDHYVRLHEGRTTAVNRAEGGTRVTVQVPVHHVEGSPAEAT